MPAGGWPDTEPSRGSKPSRARDRGQRGKPRTAAQAAAVGTDCHGTEGGEALKPRREGQRGSTENARERWTKPPSEAGRSSGRGCNSLRSHSCRNLSHRGRYNVERSNNALCACGASGGLDRGTLDTGRITEGGKMDARTEGGFQVAGAVFRIRYRGYLLEAQPQPDGTERWIISEAGEYRADAPSSEAGCRWIDTREGG